MKKTLLFLILPLAILFSATPLGAVEESTSSSDITDEEVSNNLKKRLQESLSQAKENIIGSPTELPTDPRAFVGTVQDIIQESINVTTKDGLRYAVTTDDTTIIRSPGNKIIKPSSIQIDDFIIAMGYLETEDKLTSSRIIVSSSITPTLAKTTGVGTITELTSKLLTLTAPTLSDSQEIILNTRTVYKDKDGVVEYEDLEIGMTIIYTAKQDDDDLIATIIMLTGTSEDLTTDEDSVE